MTAEGRIQANRPGVLDDGTGGKIVGWEDGDLAMAELKEWEPTRPGHRALARLAAPRPSLLPPPPAPVAPPAPAALPVFTQALPPACVIVPPRVPTAPGPVVAPAAYSQVVSESSIMAQVEPYESVAVMAEDVEDVAEAPPAEEDDWEWTIALARARAEEVDPAAVKPKVKGAASNPPVRPAAQIVAASPMPSKATAIMSTVAPPPAASSAASSASARLESAIQTRQMSSMPTTVIAAADPASSGAWPKTELIGGQIDYEQTAISAAIPMPVAKSPTARTASAPPAPRARPATAPPAPRARPVTTPPQLFSTSAPLPRVPMATPPAPARSTVIPVPSLPTVAGSAQPQARPLSPVVRSSTSQPPTVGARRLSKGTAPVEPEADAQMTAQLAELATGDETQTQVNLSIGDSTTPGIAMPMVARAVQLPSTKRAARR